MRTAAAAVLLLALAATAVQATTPSPDCPAGSRKEIDGDCTELDTRCGSNCFECSGRACARCTPDKFLENGLCVDACSGDEGVRFVLDPYSKICRTEASTSGGSSDDGIFAGTTLYIVIGAIAVVILCAAGIITYICIDRRANDSVNLALAQQQAQNIRMRRQGETGTGDVVVQLRDSDITETSVDGPVPTIAWGTELEESSSDDPGTQNRAAGKSLGATLNTGSSADGAPAALPSKSSELRKMFKEQQKAAEEIPAAAALAIDTTPTTELTETEAARFHKRLHHLRKHKDTFVVIMHEMKRRQATKKGAARAKYDSLIADLARLMVLLKQKRAERVVPVDGNKLLDWAQMTLDRFLAQQGQA